MQSINVNLTLELQVKSVSTVQFGKFIFTGLCSVPPEQTTSNDFVITYNIKRVFESYLSAMV